MPIFDFLLNPDKDRSDVPHKRLPTEAIKTIGSGVAKLMPRGGVRHPDSMITNGPNRSLYLPKGRPISPIPGFTPTMGKHLLVGPEIHRSTMDLKHLRNIQKKRG